MAERTEDGGGGGRQRRAQAPARHDRGRAKQGADVATDGVQSSTSPETLEALIKGGGRVVATSSGRARASSVLIDRRGGICKFVDTLEQVDGHDSSK